MSPKYKGKSEDWLDDQKTRKTSSRSDKNSKPKRDYIDPIETNALVIEVFPNQCLVKSDLNHEKIACSYRKARLPQLETRDRAPVAVGDRVKIEIISAKDGVIDGVGRRKNELVRPSPMSALRHVIAANVDQLIIVASCIDPEFNQGIVDRFLIAAQTQGIHPIICVTKQDLYPANSSQAKPWQIYIDLGFEVHELSIQDESTLNPFLKAIDSKVSVFAGHSGVGKTSLLNSLCSILKLNSNQARSVGDVNSYTGKGNHTTTGAYFVQDTQYIDTPGIKSFGLLNLITENLKDYFPEFQGRSCLNASCMHQDEEGCAMKTLERYPNYIRILNSLIEEENL